MTRRRQGYRGIEITDKGRAALAGDRLRSNIEQLENLEKEFDQQVAEVEAKRGGVVDARLMNETHELREALASIRTGLLRLRRLANTFAEG